MESDFDFDYRIHSWAFRYFGLSIPPNSDYREQVDRISYTLYYPDYSYSTYTPFFWRKREILVEHCNDFQIYLGFIFGLIHGLGFSGYLRSLLGQEEDIIFPLFAFNLGLEAGQILIMMAFMIFSWFVHAVFRPKLQQWTLLGTGIIIGIALILLRDTWPWG